MKIAMIGHKRIPSREGGIEIVVEELSVQMAAMGHRIDVYNRRGAHVSKDTGRYPGKGAQRSGRRIKNYKQVRILTIPTLKSRQFNAIVYSLLATVRALWGRYDVIHYHAEGPSAFLWIPHLFGKRTITTIHGLDWQRAKWGGFATRFLKYGERVAAKYADEIIVLSKNVQNYFLETYGRETNYLPNGVHQPDILDERIINEKYGLEKDGYILFLARIVPEKGLHYLIDAYKQLNPSLKLVIAGGVSHSNAYMREIRDKVSGLNNIVMTGFVEGAVLESLYSNAYIYVLPSDVEGMPLSLLEAMSYGNCCLVSNIKENTEVVGKYALSFQKSSINDLTEKLNYLIEHQEVVAGYKKSAGKYILERFNWAGIVRQTLYIYGDQSGMLEKNKGVVHENINGK